ncbi:MAG: hypothetical protein IT374_26150 [Polyangiaceae bacterium]|nr:hypothetical protein [Polyangiaceae bacterium]
MVAVPNPLALLIALPLGAVWTLVALVIDALRALDAALALWLSEPRGVDERGCWS